MRDVKELFSYLHNTDFPYVVLRNWENLPDNPIVGEHSDLDLLVYDADHFRELFPQAKRTFPHPRVQHRLPIGNSYILIDVRYLGDGYYPERFEREILEFRMMNEKGFYTPDPLRFKVALSYHAVHHKNCNKYQYYLGDQTIEDMLEALKESNVCWSEPEDPTVGNYYGYFKGSTSTAIKENGKVKKTQNMFFEFDVLKNEARILKHLAREFALTSPDKFHFPIIFSESDREIEIEDCGYIMTTKNAPKNYKEQLSNIIKDLKKARVVHRDIRPNNLLVKDDVIKLIDFGWARLSDEKDEDVPHPPSLGDGFKPSYGFDDMYSMKMVIKKISYSKEGKCIS